MYLLDVSFYSSSLKSSTTSILTRNSENIINLNLKISHRIRPRFLMAQLGRGKGYVFIVLTQ
jgi:hypothetical protein